MPEREHGTCGTGAYLLFILIFAVVKLILTGLTTRLLWPKNIWPFLAIAFSGLSFWLYLPYQHIELPGFLEKTVHYVYWILPLLSPAMAVWSFIKSTGDVKIIIAIVGAIDLVMVIFYSLFAFQMIVG